jgi:hypothetical protein
MAAITEKIPHKIGGQNMGMGSKFQEYFGQ